MGQRKRKKRNMYEDKDIPRLREKFPFHVFVPRVADFDDEGFDALDLGAAMDARRQRALERFIAFEEWRELHDELEECWLSSGVNARQICRPLVAKYANRMQWIDGVLPPDATEEETLSRIRFGRGRVVDDKKGLSDIH